MKDSYKMFIELNINDKNIQKVEELTQMLLRNNVISFREYSDVLTAAMSFKSLNVEQEELPENVIVFERKSR